MATGGSRAWAGWIAFAGMLLVLIGMINIFQGFVALIWDERVVATPENFVLVDVTSWGWTLLLSGVLLIAVSAGLFAAKTWARITAIVIVLVHAASQVAWLGAYPVWSLLMIGLDTVVLFALTARWSESRDDLTAYGNRAGADGLPAEPMTAHTAPQARNYQTRAM